MALPLAASAQVDEFERLAAQSTASLAAAQKDAEAAAAAVGTAPGSQLRQLLDQVRRSDGSKICWIRGVDPISA